MNQRCSARRIEPDEAGEAVLARDDDSLHVPRRYDHVASTRDRGLEIRVLQIASAALQTTTVDVLHRRTTEWTARVRLGFTRMVKSVGGIRLKFQACRVSNAPLSTWRELQLEILAAAKLLRMNTTEPEAPASVLWSMMSDAFWLERDITRLSNMVEMVIAELERTTLERRATLNAAD